MRLIDADALKKQFEEVYPLSTNEMGCIINNSIYDIIDNAPTLPNPCGSPCNFTIPTGEWICTFHSTFPQYEPDEYRCSKCNGKGGKSDKFCKHCGVKMKKEAKNERT